MIQTIRSTIDFAETVWKVVKNGKISEISRILRQEESTDLICATIVRKSEYKNHIEDNFSL